MDNRKSATDFTVDLAHAHPPIVVSMVLKIGSEKKYYIVGISPPSTPVYYHGGKWIALPAETPLTVRRRIMRAVEKASK